MKTKSIVGISIIAALYFIFTVYFPVLSYGVIQFRISEGLKVFVLFNPLLSFGIGIGTFFANMFSPYSGPLELVFMPITDIFGGLLAWYLYSKLKNRYAACTLYAITTSVSVALMLSILGIEYFMLAFSYIFVSEIIILLSFCLLFSRQDIQEILNKVI